MGESISESGRSLPAILRVGILTVLVERLIHCLASGSLCSAGGHLLHSFVAHHFGRELGLGLLQTGVRFVVDGVNLENKQSQRLVMKHQKPTRISM